jgi:predicted DNA-binding protein (MmcQ/YjbR family)
MINFKHFRKLALSFPGAEEHPHFEIVAFKVNKKIFVTLNEKHMRACVKLSEIDQSAFCSYDAEVMYPVPNKWGKQGWTLINLAKVPEEMLRDTLQTSFDTVKVKKKKA